MGEKEQRVQLESLEQVHVEQIHVEPPQESPVMVQVEEVQSVQSVNSVQEPAPEQVEHVPVVQEVDDFVYSGQLTQIKTIMALEGGEQDEHIKTLLVQHKGDIARVVPLLL